MDAPVLSDDPDADPQYRMQPSRIDENWPADVDLAVCLTFDTQGAIDGLREGYQTTRWPDGSPNWWDYTERQYGISRGLPRLLDILDEHDVPGTFPTPGLTAEWYPDRVREIADRGHEVACHSHTHRLLYGLDRDEEREEVGRATAAIEAVTGTPPSGWRCPVYSLSHNTLDLLTEHGYAWDSSLHNHDYPYVLTDGENRLIELPVNFDDWTLFLMQTRQGGHMGGYPRGTPRGVGNVLRREFDQLLTEGRRTGEPRTFMYVMHPKITGRPHRAACLDDFIAYAAGHDGVRFTTCSDLADLAGA